MVRATDSEKRRFPRRPFREPVAVCAQGMEAAAARYEGVLSCDLGEGGVRFYTGDFIPPGTALDLMLPLGPEEMTILSGRVAWVRKLPHAETYQAGVAFSEGEETAAERRRLRSFIQRGSPVGR